MRRRASKRVAVLALAALALLWGAPDMLAQGCVLCRTSAAAGGEEAQRALNVGVLILLIPTLAIFCGVLVFAARYRK